MVNERCDGCRFWIDVDEPEMDLGVDGGVGVAVGKCRRNPPSRATILDQDTVGAEWENWSHPFTLEDDWCGEFQPVKAEKPAEAIKTKTSIDTLKLPQFLIETFANNDITSVEELTSERAYRLLRLSGIGKERLNQIIDAVKTAGFHFKGDQPASKSTT